MSETPRSTICVDASFVIPRVIPGAFSARVRELFEQWTEAGAKLVATSLLHYES